MGRATIRRSEQAVQECEDLLELMSEINEVAQRIKAAARVVVILDELSTHGHARGELAYHQACIDALSKL